MTAKAEPKTPTKSTTGLPPDIEALVDAKVTAKLTELKAAGRLGLNLDDATFLVWTLGFVAGANLERDGERGERIFARCRQIHEKLAPVQGGMNPS